jgi:outer membrane immunogenic protein
MRCLPLLAAFVAATGFAQIASAADMPTKAPAMVPAIAPMTWTGPYVGVAGGYGWGTTRQTDVTPFNSGDYSISGAILGATLGYNWQAGGFVFGVETDLSWASIDGSTTGIGGGCFGNHCASEIQALGTVRGRLGVAWGNWLPFIAGGLAYARLHGEEGPPLGGSDEKWVAGWTIGGGVEAMLAPRWSAKAEYLYVDLGTHGVFTDALGGGARATENLDTFAHVVRVGLNYHFATW